MQKFSEQLARIEEQLSDTSLYEESNKEKLKKLLSEQATLQEQNDDTEEQWLVIQEELEALETEI